MRLGVAYICPECEEITTERQCPKCTSTNLFPLAKWLSESAKIAVHNDAIMDAHRVCIEAYPTTSAICAERVIGLVKS